MSQIIEVKRPVFSYKKKKPSKVSYKKASKKRRAIVCETYPHGFPDLEKNQILYKLQGFGDRGYILDIKPKQEMTEYTTPSKTIKYTHYIIWDGKKYRREENMSPKCFTWESEPNDLRDQHTIKWRLSDDEEVSMGYYSCDHGWSGEGGHLRPQNPIPEIEKIFKETIGKDLLYFNGIEKPKQL